MADADLPPFFKVFISRVSSDSLHIPISYYGQLLPHPLPTTATLQGNGGRLWKVSMEKMDDEEVYFRGGWSKFVQENSVADRDMMTFVYQGDCRFQVTVYDSRTEFPKVISSSTEIILRSKKKGKSKVEDVEELWRKRKRKVVEESSDDEDYVEAKTKRGRRGKSKRTSGPKPKTKTTRKVDPRIKDPERLLDDKNNPHFETILKNRTYELLVDQRAINKYGLELEDDIVYVDDVGELETTYKNWNDRVVIKKWDLICERNDVEEKDAILCEFFRNNNEGRVHKVKIHIVPRGRSAGVRM